MNWESWQPFTKLKLHKRLHILHTYNETHVSKEFVIEQPSLCSIYCNGTIVV